MKTSDFDFILPEALIAQYPECNRVHARLLMLDKEAHTVGHAHFYDILAHFNAGDVLVLNDTKVIPARLFAYKESTGARIEILLVDKVATQNACNEQWEVLMRPSRRVKAGDTLIFKKGERIDDTFSITIAEEDAAHEGMERIVTLKATRPIRECIAEYGAPPLPPYIKRVADRNDHELYQTVFAHNEGAVAAPTAGLHFDTDLLDALRAKGVCIHTITLHVGYGTFQPVKDEDLKRHTLHTERFTIDQSVANSITDAKREGRRIVACGTTVVRALESAVEADGTIRSGEQSTTIFFVSRLSVSYC